jgi:CRP/FNR family cyclic AMP-dependent transcriptional regulator
MTLDEASPVPGTFLAALDEGERAELEQLGIPRTFPRGSVLMYEREPEDRLMLILRGRVKVSRVDQSGRELVLDIGDPGDVLGELAFVDGMPRMATVTALEPVETLVMDAKRFQAYVTSKPTASAALIEVMAGRFREAQAKRSQFITLDTMGRLASRLVELADRYGEAKEAGIEVRLPISQEELAAWTGASRTGVSQSLQALRELGWIALERRRLVIRDIDSLRARAQ